MFMIQVVKDPDLRERNLGDLQGLQLREAAHVKPLAYKAFLSHRTDEEIPVSFRWNEECDSHLNLTAILLLSRIPLSSSTYKCETLSLQGGGESIDQLYERCTSSLERISRKHKGIEVSA